MTETRIDLLTLKNRMTRNAIVMLASGAAIFLPDSTLRSVLIYSAGGYVVIDQALNRFSAIPAVAMLIFVGMTIAFESGVPLIGAARSTTRAVWAGVSVLFMLVGAIGLVIAVEKLAEGDPSRQFTGFGRPRPRSPSA